ncbi:RNA-binding protein 1-like, partial [Carica papaya]|uniref:RNA-binding protein 1-like n=1 Tax=Carica papaya TaxID=3649 RepID=UPI000B8C9B67
IFQHENYVNLCVSNYADLLPSGHEIHGYLPRDDDRGARRSVKDTKTIGSAYDQYLQNAHSSQLLLKQLSPFTSGEASSFGGVALGRAVGGGISSLQMADAMIGRAGATARDLAPNGRSVGLSSPLPGDGASRSSQEILSLPPDASSTLYVEGLPPDCTKREVAHIFRPFVGYREVRIVSKESKHRGGDLSSLFCRFASPACAATAMSALQGDGVF